jgi:uncharacterized spore protein YtfJ
VKQGLEKIDTSAVESQEQAKEILEKLFLVAEPGTIFSAPVQQDDYTVITASEISIGMGVGFGSGQGTDDEGHPGGGGGGGGGGGSMGRPVAAITIGPDGVRVEPIVDVTKLGIALFTTLGAIFMAWRAMRRNLKR